MLVSKRFRNAVMLCHLPWACRHSHPPCSPSGGWWPQLPLPSGAFTASLPRARPSRSTSFWQPACSCSCACPCLVCLRCAWGLLAELPDPREMSVLWQWQLRAGPEDALHILRALQWERLTVPFGLDAAQRVAGGKLLPLGSSAF